MGDHIRIGGNGDRQQALSVAGGGLINGPVTMNVTGNHDRVLPVWQVDQKRWLPLGERAVGLIAALMTIGAGLSGGTAVSRAVADFPEPLTQPTLWSIGLFVAAFLPMVLAWVAWRAARHRLVHFHRFGNQRAIGFSIKPGCNRAQLAAFRLSGTCTMCGGRLRFRRAKFGREAKSDWQGRVTGSVPDIQMAVVCTRNRRHRWPVDPAQHSL